MSCRAAEQRACSRAVGRGRPPSSPPPPPPSPPFSFLSSLSPSPLPRAPGAGRTSRSFFLFGVGGARRDVSICVGGEGRGERWTLSWRPRCLGWAGPGWARVPRVGRRVTGGWFGGLSPVAGHKPAQRAPVRGGRLRVPTVSVSKSLRQKGKGRRRVWETLGAPATCA